jgi:tetratricopeptide (TPR) repeat protein
MTVDLPLARRCPAGSISLAHLGEEMWEFQYPRLTESEYDAFDVAQETWYRGDPAAGEAGFRRLVGDYPEFIDAYHHLAMLLDETGRRDEALRIWQETVQMGLICLPAEFIVGRDHLPWDCIDNRPFLRAYHGLGLEMLERHEVTRALAIFEHILALNPDDNQGVRALVVDCCFQLKLPSDVLALCRRFRGDFLEALLFGRALALYQLGRKAQAGKALQVAIRNYPKIAQELIKPRHRAPKDLRADRITEGGADQAYWYWRDQGQHWKETPGALAWVAETVAGHATTKTQRQ